jgi:hypothetical protein
MVELLKIQVFWDVMPCRWASSSIYFELTCPTTQYHIPEDPNLK